MRKFFLPFSFLVLSCFLHSKKNNPDYLYLLYQNYYNFLQYEKAERTLKELVSLYPKKEYIEEYIKILYSLKKYDEILSVYKKYKNRIQFSKEILIYLIVSTFIKKDEKSYTHLKNYFLSLMPFEEKDAEFLINIEILKGDKDKVLKLIEFFEKYFKENENIVRLKAEILIQLGKIKEGLELLENLKTKNERDFILMGDAYQKISDYDKSLFYFLKVDSIRERDLDIKKNIIYILIQKSEYKKADSICNVLLSLKNMEPEYLRIKGYLNYEMENLQEAMKNLLLGVEINPKDDLSYYYLSRIYYKLSNYDKALDYINKAIEINPNVPEYISYKIFLEIVRGNKRGAFYEIKKGLKRFPSDPGINYFAGFLLSQVGKKRKAIEFYEKSLKNDSLNANKWFELGMIYESLNLIEEAEKCFERVIKIDSLNGAAYNYWGYMLAERGIKLEFAKNLIEKALKISPENGFYLDSFGWVYYQLGDYEKAKEYLYRAVQIEDADPVILEHYGDVLKKLGELEEAKKFYRRALELNPKNKSLLKKIAE